MVRRTIQLSGARHSRRNVKGPCFLVTCQRSPETAECCPGHPAALTFEVYRKLISCLSKPSELLKIREYFVSENNTVVVLCSAPHPSSALAASSPLNPFPRLDECV